MSSPAKNTVGFRPAVKQERYRPIIDQGNFHGSLKNARFHALYALLQEPHELSIQPVGLLPGGRLDEAARLEKLGLPMTLVIINITQ